MLLSKLVVSLIRKEEARMFYGLTPPEIALDEYYKDLREARLRQEKWKNETPEITVEEKEEDVTKIDHSDLDEVKKIDIPF